MSKVKCGSETQSSESELWIKRNNQPLFQLKNYYFGFIWDLRRYLEGKVLTIIDASIQDLQQRKALKDLIREAIHSEEYITSEFLEVLTQFNDVAKLNELQTADEQKEFLGNRASLPSTGKKYFNQ